MSSIDRDMKSSIVEISLCRLDVAFTLTFNSKVLLSTKTTSSLMERVRDICGSENVADMKEIKSAEDHQDIVIEGCCSIPTEYNSTCRMQLVIVDGYVLERQQYKDIYKMLNSEYTKFQQLRAPNTSTPSYCIATRGVDMIELRRQHKAMMLHNIESFSSLLKRVFIKFLGQFDPLVLEETVLENEQKSPPTMTQNEIGRVKRVKKPLEKTRSSIDELISRTKTERVTYGMLTSDKPIIRTKPIQKDHVKSSPEKNNHVCFISSLTTR